MQQFTGKQYLQIDIANNYGLDKLTWDERLDWFKKNEHRLHELMHEAAEPALFFAGVKAYGEVLEGKPSGYPISLDATSSGLQILAVLTGDRKAAELCNVVNAGSRKDGYTVVYDEMCKRIGDSSKILRDEVKQAIMTSLYGSEAVPKEVFGEGLLLNVFYQTMEELAPGAWELNKAFLSMWDPNATVNSWVLPDNFHVNVKVMDTIKERVHFLNQPFDTFVKVNQPMEEGRSLGANTVHSIDGMIVREISRRCTYNVSKVNLIRKWISEWQNNQLPKQDYSDEASNSLNILMTHYGNSGYLSARIMDFIHSKNITMVPKSLLEELLNSLPDKPFEVIAVHDCFRCLPNYGNDLRKQYNLQLMLIANSELLSYLISQLLGKRVHVGKLDRNLWQDIEFTEYALS